MQNLPWLYRSAPDIQVDELRLQVKKEQRVWRLHAVEIPIVRAFGFALLSLGVFLHNTFIPNSGSSQAWLLFTMTAGAYVVLSWASLRFFYGRTGRFDLGLFFLTADLFLWTLAIYASGADRSWLFFILILRAADQVLTTFRHELLFAHVGTACYLAMLLFADGAAGEPVDWAQGLVKTAMIYGASMYIGLAGRTAEHRRQQTSAAIRMARESIRKLDEKSRELEEARYRAEEASAAKSDFLANMSHEVRTPLNAILGLTQLSSLVGDPAENRRYLQMIRSSAESLLTVLNDVLDYSKIEARKLELEVLPFRLRTLLIESLRTLAFNAEEKGLACSLLVDPEVPNTLVGDATRLRQVVVNLVSNSLKFTSAGSIAVTVAAESTGPPGTLRFSVVDTGIGIPYEKQATIFEAFMQADGSMTRRFGGTGLGLAISARLVEMMGGHIWLESRLQQGSSFYFTAHFGLDQQAQDETAPQVAEKIRVIVGDRSAESRGSIVEALRRWGVTTIAFDKPEVAARAIGRARALDQPFSLVLLDADFIDAIAYESLPPVGENGDPEWIVALLRNDAAYARPARFSRWKIDEYLRQPVAPYDLARALLRATERAGSGTLAPPLRGAQRDVPLEVLVAEDNVVNQEVLLGFLKRRGHKPTVANHGREVLELTKQRQFDAILMDVQMPEVDGLQAATIIRAREKESGGHVPIIAITAHAMKADRERCLAAGMDAYLAKPIDPAQLFEIFDRLVYGAPVTTGGAQLTPGTIITHFYDDPAFARRVAQIFLDASPKMLLDIRASLDREDRLAVRNAAHALKGSVGNFPADAAHATLLHMEKCALTATREELEECYTNIVRELEQFKPVLLDLCKADVAPIAE